MTAPPNLSALFFTRDGKHLAATDGTGDYLISFGSVKVWDTATGKEIYTTAKWLRASARGHCGPCGPRAVRLEVERRPLVPPTALLALAWAGRDRGAAKTGVCDLSSAG